MSVGKKNPYVFTIGFDRKNPEHLEVVEILNGTEKKAALIAEAVLQYMGKKPGGETGVSQESIQAMVRLLVRQEMDRIAAIDQNCRLIKGQVFLWEGASGWEDLWDMDVK